MRILIDLKKVNGSFNYKGRIRIKMKIGEALSLSSESSSYSDGAYAFLEKQVIRVDKLTGITYVQISILNESNIHFAQITVFFSKFRELSLIELRNLHNDKEVYRLHYQMLEIADDDHEAPDLRGTNTLEAPAANAREDSGKLQILRLGLLVYNFSQRLDPLIYLYNLTLDLLSWKNALKTVAGGILMTLAIYNLKTAIFTAGLVLYFCKGFLFRRLQKMGKYKNQHKRMIVPEENMYFLQNGMDWYCLWYENGCQFLFNDDKTLLVTLINLLCKMGTALIVLLLLFGVQHLLVIGLWTVLVLSSPYRAGLVRYLGPALEFVVGEYSRIVDRITSGISEVLGSSPKAHQDHIEREFYFYKYERWWVLKGWLDESKKFSDQDYECFVVPRDHPPEAWAWTEEWKIDYSGDVDSDGFQYTNDLKNSFQANNTLATRRRRKWKRACAKLANPI